MLRRILSFSAAVLVVAALGQAVSAGSPGRRLTATPLRVIGTPIQAATSASGRLARSDRGLLRLTGSRPVSVMAKLDYDPVASYAGGIPGLEATSPAVTGRPLDDEGSAAAAYEGYVGSLERRVEDAVRGRIPNAVIRRSFRIAYGGLAIQVPAGRVRDLLSIPGVVAVQRDVLEQPMTSVTPHFLGADRVWPLIGGQDDAGSNVIVANIDTGVWPESPSFVDRGLPAPPGTYGCQFGDGTDPTLGAPFTCNDKLIGAYAFTTTYLEAVGAVPGEFCDMATMVCSARDPDGHGTHTLSTAAGDRVDSAKIFGIERGPISGMAPGAHVIAYRVCLVQGCFESDSVAAVQQAIQDGVDVLNYSIGGGADPFSDPVELAFLDAYAAGMLVNASAGNDGPDAGTVEHGGPWVDTVGASYSPRNFLTTLHLRASNGDTFAGTGATITPGIASPTSVVDAGDLSGYHDSLCKTPLPSGSATGKVIVCKRGVNGRNEKSFNVMHGGGAGMILYNPTHQDLFTDNFWVPTIMVDAGKFRGKVQPAAAMNAFIASHSGVTATWDTGRPTSVRPDVMTIFSSKGPVGDFVKPNVTAPGIQILAGNTPEPIDVAAGPPGELFQVIAGTSMSAPHATGVAALVKAVHPDWTPGQVLSALMTSTVQDVLKEDGNTPADPFDDGSGSIRADRAVHPTLTFDVPAGAYAASASDPLHRVDLNLPSVDATIMPGILTTTRTGHNVSGARQDLTVHTTAPKGATIEVTPAHVVLGPGAKQAFTITIDGESLPEGQYFGSIEIEPRSAATSPVFIPVAFTKAQGAISLSNTCRPAAVRVGGNSSCSVKLANQGTDAANVRLSVANPAPGKVAIQHVSRPGTPHGGGLSFHGTLAATKAPKITSITQGGTGAGYFPLSAIGVPPIPGVGDETMVSLGTSPFLFGGETYDQIGMASDGYAVVGDAGPKDLSAVPQTFPDPAAPNNVLAPFWTDLDPSVSGAIYAAEVTDTRHNWIVLDWEGVPTAGTTEFQTFEIWIQIDAGIEAVSFEYETVAGPGAPSGLNEGAENRTGTSGVNIHPLASNGTQLSVNTSKPGKGGSVTIRYRVHGLGRGTFAIPARVRSNVTKGITADLATVRVR